MLFGRRAFLRLGAAASFAACLGRPVPVLSRQDLLADPAELQHWLEMLSAQGPRYTGNRAHVAFVNFLRDHFEAAGLDVVALPYSFSRWDATATSLRVTPPGGAPTAIPVTSYYPRSGQTRAAGVTAPLVYGGGASSVTLPVDVKDSIVYIDCPIPPFPYEACAMFGSYPTGTLPPLPQTRATIAFDTAPTLASLQTAGAAGAILGWSTISDEQAMYQYQPFKAPQTQVPALWVGKSQTTMLEALALAGGSSATLTLEAVTERHATTETLIATLPGMTSDILIVNTHTDGPNVVEENGGLALLSIARYFARIPLSQRQKTLVFVLATGHMAEPLVPSTAWISQRPDIIAKTVGVVTIEHLGALDWDDNLTHTSYAATGMNESALAQTYNTGTANAMLAGLTGSTAAPTIVGADATFSGVGGPLNALGLPTIGFILNPAYLLTGSPHGEIEKVSVPYMYGQIAALIATIALLDKMTPAQIAGTRVIPKAASNLPAAAEAQR